MTAGSPPQPGWWVASDGNWYPPELRPGASADAGAAYAAQAGQAGGNGSEPAMPPQPGWWVASDGNWYPPESHPSAVATMTPAPVVTATAQWEGPTQTAAPSWNALPGNGDSTHTAAAPATPPATIPAQPAVDDFYAKRGQSGTKPFWRVTAAEDDTLDAGKAKPGWEQSLGAGERKGLRTVRSATNYFIRSSIMGALYIGFLIIVLINPNQIFLLIGAPILVGFRYIFTTKRGPGLLAEVSKRSGYSEHGTGWARESSRNIFLLRAAAAIAIVAFVCGMLGNVLFWKAQLFGSNSQIKKMLNDVSGSVNGISGTGTGTVSTTTTTSASDNSGGDGAVQQEEQQQQQYDQQNQQIQKVLKQNGL